MKSIEKRIEKIESKLNVGKEPVIMGIVYFGDGELPPKRAL